MSSYPNLPGVQVYTIDGGLASRTVPQDKAVLICGTAGQGPSSDPFQVVDRAAAASTFGLNGSLIKAMEEVAANSDNVILFRIGTQPTFLNGVGGTTTGTGVTIEFGSTDTDVQTEYNLWYKNGILYIWFEGDIVFANDPTNGYVIDTGDCTITGSLTGLTGLEIGTGTTASLANSLTLAAAGALTGSTGELAPTLVPGTDGLSMSLRDTYVALAQGLDLLSIYPTDSIYCPDAYVDAPNVAYRATALGNPNVLDWLKTTVASDGTKTYQWASETVDSEGNTVPAMSSSVTTSALRLAAGFHEVHFEYLIANFCYVQETVGGGGTCIGFIGTTGPNSFSLLDTRNWIGFLPTYSTNVSTEPIQAGMGILGIPTIVGTVAMNLNVLCKDSGTYRQAGLFLTTEGEYDGNVVFDANSNPVDLGAYIHVFADQGVISNGYALNYATNLAGVVAGLASTLDEKLNLTNKSINAVQLWKASFGQMDSLTWAGINVLRFKSNGVLPVCLHGFTIATDASDYHNLLRQRIKGLVVDTIRTTADPYIGNSSTDGLQLQAMQTALDAAMTNLQKRGYISRYSFVVNVTQAEQRIGHANIYVSFYPADELVQLTATVGISRS